MNTQITETTEDELDVKTILRNIWASKILILSITFIATLLTAIYSIFLPNIYQSSVILEPEQSQTSSNFGGMSNLLGGFGANFNQTIGRTEQALEIIESKDFFEKLYQDDVFLTELMAYDSSNSADAQIDKEIYNIKNNEWLDGKPTLEEAYRTFYADHFSKSAPKRNPFVTLRISHYSPLITKKWLDRLLEELDLYMKERDSKISQESINFLEEKLSKANQNTKPYLVQLLMIETQNLIQTKVNSNYAFTIIDSPRVPQFKVSPMRTILCLIAAGLSFFLIFTIILVCSVFNKELYFSFKKFKFLLKDIEI